MTISCAQLQLLLIAPKLRNKTPWVFNWFGIKEMPAIKESRPKADFRGSILSGNEKTRAWGKMKYVLLVFFGCCFQRIFQGGQLGEFFPRQTGLGEMSVVGCLPVNWAEQGELIDDVRWLEGKDFAYGVSNSGVSHGTGAQRVHADASWMWVADGVGDLELATFGKACGDNVLGHPAAHVGSGAVNF